MTIFGKSDASYLKNRKGLIGKISDRKFTTNQNANQVGKFIQ